MPTQDRFSGLHRIPRCRLIHYSRNHADIQTPRSPPGLFRAIGVTLIGVTLTATPAAASGNAAATATEVGPSIVLDDGRTVGQEGIEFTFEGTPPKESGASPGAYCPEVNDPPVYTVRGTPQFIADKSRPQSTWLLPRQTVTWTVTGTRTFTAGLVVGGETEVGAIIAKAKLKIDAKIEHAWTTARAQTVSDTNSTTKAYRAVLGQVGWRLTAKKSWMAKPCSARTSTIVVDAPRAGDLSIGRYSS